MCQLAELNPLDSNFVVQYAYKNYSKKYGKEVNLNADKKRFWFGTLKNINEKTMIRSFPLNPQRFPKAFELNYDYE